VFGQYDGWRCLEKGPRFRQGGEVSGQCLQSIVLLPSRRKTARSGLLPGQALAVYGSSDAQGHNPQQITSDSSEAVDHLEPNWSTDGEEHRFFRILERTKFSIKVVNGRERARAIKGRLPTDDSMT